jgi:hypothetical protein
MKKLSIAEGLLAAPAALTSADLAAIEGGEDNGGRPVDFDEKKAWEVWWETHRPASPAQP